ncbi:MAG: hypothetical protein QM820_52040 [Minicystis sp.]
MEEGRGAAVIRLQIAGPHTLVLSTLCAGCPMGPAGCCATPPGIEWSDVGRIVALGGKSFVLQRIAQGSLRPGARGLLIKRVPGPEGEPLRCVFHGPTGCTIPPERRAATCNYYVCDDALTEGGEARGDSDAVKARRVLDTLVASFGGWDREIADRVAARWPEGPPWDEAFLDWLGEEFTKRARRLRMGRSSR